jgi:hypothetical protein
MLIVKGADPVLLRASFTVAVKVNGLPELLEGVPLRTPSDESVRPGGRVPPVTLQVKGDVPPVSVRVKGVYATLTSPPGSGEVVVMLGPALIVRLNGPDALLFTLSFTVTVNE